MFQGLPSAPFFAVLIALLPAALRWWWGRSLARLADDPAIAERLVAHRARVQAATFACTLLLCIPWSSAAVWGVPLLIVASSAAGHSLRKALYNETWTRRQSLSFYVRLWIAVFGFWVLLGITPWVSRYADRNDWIVGVALAALLAAWNHYAVDVIRAILRARTITDETLNERFAALVARSGIDMPRFEFVEMRGGVLANALALPSLRRSSVLFTETLLSRFSTDEIVAIAAHELAHLEYYDRARVRTTAITNYALIAGAALAAPLGRLTVAASERSFAALLWPAVLVLTLVVRAKHRQKNETASDLRAIELTGDPEALASALTALHVIARVPRRWDQRREQHATHPSLARRLRDIRAAAGLSTAPIDATTPFRAASAEAVVVFEPARLNWQESSGATHLFNYTALSELRLHASPTGGVTLVAVERQGRRWQMTPHAADIAALQSALDTVDGRLTHEVKSTVFSAAVARLVTFVAAWLIMLSAQVSVGLVALLAIINAGPALLNAAGAAALVGAAIVLRDGSSITAYSPFFAAFTACAGVIFLALGWARRTVTSRFDAPLTALIAVSAVLAVGATAIGGLDPIRLHQGARALPSATVLLVALATACWTRRERPIYRHVALASVLLGGVVTALGTTTFLDAAGRDPFLAAAPRATQIALGSTQIGSFDLPFSVASLQLSPRGTLAAATRSEDDETETRNAPPRIYVGRTSVPLSRVEASGIAFVDERRALLLVMTDTSADVQEVTFDGSTPVNGWRERISGVHSGTLTYLPRGNRWVLLGRDESNRFVRAEGIVGQRGVTTTTWTGLTSRGSWIDAIATHDASALITERHYEFTRWRQIPFVSLVPGLQRYPETRLARIEGGARIEAGVSRLETSCTAGTLPEERIVCAAFDGTRTHLAAIDPATAAVTPLVMLDGRFWGGNVVADGWTSGWWESGPAAIHLRTHAVVRAPRIADEFVSLVTATDAVVATVSPLDEGARVRLYPTRGPTQSARRDE